jgi:hypothetical protein
MYIHVYIGETLRMNTGTSVTATVAPKVTDISPTSMPTSPPQSKGILSVLLHSTISCLSGPLGDRFHNPHVLKCCNFSTNKLIKLQDYELPMSYASQTKKIYYVNIIINRLKTQCPPPNYYVDYNWPILHSLEESHANE